MPVARQSTLTGAISIVALLMRIGVLAIISPVLDAAGPLSVDASSYHALAQNLVERGIYTSPVDPPYDLNLPGTFRPPLTPFFLAGWYMLFGVDLIWGRLGLAVISALSCGLTYLVGERLFERWVGLLAGVLCSVYPFLLLLVHVPLTETLSIFLILTMLTLIVLYRPQQNACVRAVLLGGVFGLTMLNKAANGVILPCLLLWALSQTRLRLRARFGLIGIMLAVTALTIAPWTLRNYRVLGFLVPVNTNGGWTLYLGNNPYTERNLDALDDGTANGWIPPKEVFKPFQDLAFTDIQAYEQRSVCLAWQFITEHPGKFLELAARKLKIFWSPYPHILDAVTWYPLAVCGLIGVGLSCKNWQQYSQLYLVIVSSLAIPVLFTSMPRFRAPLIPVLCLFASLFLVNGMRWYVQRHRVSNNSRTS